MPLVKTSPVGKVFTNGTNKNYVDVAAGLLFSGSTDGLNNYYLGVSMYHINKPNTGFFVQNTSSTVPGFKAKDWQLLPRTTVHAGGSTPITDVLTLSGSGIFQIQNNASEAVLGAALSANVNGKSNDESTDVNVYVGSWVRIGDAIIPYIALEFSGLRIGASYDINTSSLKTATQGQGGMELSLIYIHKSDDDNSVPCPKF